MVPLNRICHAKVKECYQQASEMLCPFLEGEGGKKERKEERKKETKTM